MNEDVVIRLRNWHDQRDSWQTLTEAADEIERLRADRDKWKKWAEEYFYTDPDCECPLCDQVKAAINNG